jgi:hypothetical protein
MKNDLLVFGSISVAQVSERTHDPEKACWPQYSQAVHFFAESLKRYCGFGDGSNAN